MLPMLTNAGQCRGVILRSDMIEIVEQRLESLRHLIPFKCYFYFRFYGPHFAFPMSDNVDNTLPKSDMVENMG